MKNRFSQLLCMVALMLLGLIPQSGQSQCVPDTTTPPATGFYPKNLPPAAGCVFNDFTITFRWLRDTSVKVLGQTILVPFNTFTIDTITGLPSGLSYECNLPGCVYDVSQNNPNPDTIGCIRVFGTPTIPAIYPITVHLTANANVLGNNQDQPAQVPIELEVSPCNIQGACYDYLLSSNCEGANLSITNKISSGGKIGYFYDWSVTGPGLSYNTSDESLLPITLNQAGTYIIDYEARIDTLGYTLKDATITTVNCTDLLDAGDLYWILLDPQGNELLNTSNNVLNNAGNNLPVVCNLPDFVLDTGTYEFQVWDRDQFDADDGCATNTGGSGASVFFNIPFSQNPPLIINNGGLTVSFDISHPVEIYTCRDTIELAAIPSEPVITADTLRICDGDTAWLNIAPGDSIQWFHDGVLIEDEHDPLLAATLDGLYRANYIDRNSLCRSESAPVNLEVLTLTPPSIAFNGTTFQVASPLSGLTYNWYDEKDVLVGTGPTWSPPGSGKYYATVLDPNTGCESDPSPVLDVIVTSLSDLPGSVYDLRIFPNPATDQVSVELELSPDIQDLVSLSLVGINGQTIRRVQLQAFGGTTRSILDLKELSPGLYLLRFEIGPSVVTRKLIVRR